MELFQLSRPQKFQKCENLWWCTSYCHFNGTLKVNISNLSGLYCDLWTCLTCHCIPSVCTVCAHLICYLTLTWPTATSFFSSELFCKLIKIGHGPESLCSSFLLWSFSFTSGCNGWRCLHFSFHIDKLLIKITKYFYFIKIYWSGWKVQICIVLVQKN